MDRLYREVGGLRDLLRGLWDASEGVSVTRVELRSLARGDDRLEAGAQGLRTTVEGAALHEAIELARQPIR